MPVLILYLVDFAFSLVRYLVVVGAVLYTVGHLLNAWWLQHPVVRGVIAFSQVVCAPFRKLLQALGVPCRPVDFSPLLAFLVLRVVQWVVLLLLRWYR